MGLLRLGDSPLILAGGAKSPGFKVTFPATATNWNNINVEAALFFADGTQKSMSDYSYLAGSTFDGVVGICPKGASSQYMCQMSLSSGTLAQCNVATQTLSYFVTTAPDSTEIILYGGFNTFWWPVTDIIISTITMVNTD